MHAVSQGRRERFRSNMVFPWGLQCMTAKRFCSKKVRDHNKKHTMRQERVRNHRWKQCVFWSLLQTLWGWNSRHVVVPKNIINKGVRISIDRLEHAHKYMWWPLNWPWRTLVTVACLHGALQKILFVIIRVVVAVQTYVCTCHVTCVELTRELPGILSFYHGF